MDLRGSVRLLVLTRWMTLIGNGRMPMCSFSIQDIGGLPANYLTWGCYFETGGVLKLGISMNAAYKMALETWAAWVKKRVDLNRTLVFFHTYEPSHWSGSNQKQCEVTEQPSSETKGNDRSEFGDILADVAVNMSIPVTILNITLMGAFRSDAHIGTWSHPSTVLDCSHWCLPGVPDAWNEIVFSYLLTNGWRRMLAG